MISIDPWALPPLALAQAALAVADTVVTIPASPAGLQRWVELLTSIASVVIALALIALASFLIPAAYNSRKMYRRMNDLAERLQERANPLLTHAHNAADNVDYITTAVRADVERVQAMLTATQERLTRASAQTEERIAQFNALLQVVQEEAEDLFIDTASTLRGMQAGARAMREPPRTERHDDDQTGGPQIRVEPRRHPRPEE